MEKIKKLIIISEKVSLFLIIGCLFSSCVSTKTTGKSDLPVPQVIITGTISNFNEIKTKLQPDAYLQLIPIGINGNVTMIIDAQGVELYQSDFPKMIIPKVDTFAYVAQNVKPGKYFLVAQKTIRNSKASNNSICQPASAAIFISGGKSKSFVIQAVGNLKFANTAIETLYVHLGKGIMEIEK